MKILSIEKERVAPRGQKTGLPHTETPPNES